jgi:GH24 family phage-related lysozyme (muramidase)
MEVSPPAIVIIQDEEVFKDTAYDDARPDYVLKPGDKIIGTLTIGYGHTNSARNDDDTIKIGDTVTKEEAKEILIKDLQQYVDIVNNRMKTFDVELTQPQFDGMVFATMNRPKKMSRGGLWRAIASGDEEKIREEWNKTITNSLKQFPGLANREVKELNMFLAKEQQEINSTKIDTNMQISKTSTTSMPSSLPVITKEPKVDNSEINMVWTDLYNNLANAFIDNPRTAREKELFGRNSISYKAKDKPVKVEYDSKEKQKIAEIYSGMLKAISESLKR